VKTKSQKGSITIYGVLIMILVTECLLVLLEGARFHTIKTVSKMQTEVALEAVFANYCYPLWEEYHLLGAYQTDFEMLLSVYGNSRNSGFEWRKNLLESTMEDVEIESYTLLTDGQGSVFQNAVTDYMKDNIVYETAKVIYSQYEVITDIVKTGSSEYGDIENAINQLEDNNAKKRAKTNVNSMQNPLEIVTAMQKMGILSLVIEDAETISDKEASLSDMVSKRDLNEGKKYELTDSKWLDTILLQQYLLTYMSSYENPKENHGLNYELEYILIGKGSDVENLKGVANWFLAIRQAANMVYLLSDAGKVQEAAIVATLLAGVSANPALIEVVKIALLTAWAYGESVLDVRALLQGKKIPLLKSKDTWTLQLSGIGSMSNGYATAKESEYGLSYQNYLGILLFFLKDSTLTMRAMDMQELTIRQKEGYKDFRYDSLMVQAEATLVYEYVPAFDMFEFLKSGFNWNRKIRNKCIYKYSN